MSILDYINDYKDKAPANAAGADSVLPEYRNPFEKSDDIIKNNKSLEESVNRVGELVSYGTLPDVLKLPNEDYESFLEYNVPMSATSDYDKLVKQRAKNQGVAEQLWNSLVRATVSEMGIGIAKGYVDIANFVIQAPEVMLNRIFRGVNKELDFNPESTPLNTLSEYLQQAKDNIDNSHKIYRTNPNNPLDWKSFSWYADNFPSVATTVSLMVPSYTIMKLGQLAGKAFRFTTLADKVANTMKITPKTREFLNAFGKASFMGVNSRIAENFQEAQQTYKQVYDIASRQLKAMTDEERKEWLKLNPEYEGMNDEQIAINIANAKANLTFKEDFSNLGFDILQIYTLHNLLNSPRISTPRKLKIMNNRAAANFKEGKALTEAALKTTGFKNNILEKGKNFLYDSAKLARAEWTEGVEEGINYIAQQDALYATQALFNNLPYRREDATIKQFGIIPYGLNESQFMDYVKNPEMWEQFIWGAIGGILFGGVYNKAVPFIQQKFGKQNNIQDKQKELSLLSRDNIQQQYLNNIALVNENKNPFNLNESGEAQEFNSEEEKQAIKTLIDKQFLTDLILNANQNGTIDLLQSYFENEDTLEGYANKLGENGEVKAKQLQKEVLDAIGKITPVYNENFNKARRNGADNNVAHMLARQYTNAELSLESFKNIENAYQNLYNDNIEKTPSDKSKIVQHQDAYLMDYIRKIESNIAAINNDESLLKSQKEEQLKELQKEIDIARSLLSTPHVFEDMVVNDEGETNYIFNENKYREAVQKLMDVYKNEDEDLISNMSSYLNSQIQTKQIEKDVNKTDKQVKEDIKSLNDFGKKATSEVKKTAKRNIKDLVKEYGKQEVINHLNGEETTLSDKAKSDLDNAKEILTDDEIIANANRAVREQKEAPVDNEKTLNKELIGVEIDNVTSSPTGEQENKKEESSESPVEENVKENPIVVKFAEEYGNTTKSLVDLINNYQDFIGNNDHRQFAKDLNDIKSLFREIVDYLISHNNTAISIEDLEEFSEKLYDVAPRSMDSRFATTDAADFQAKLRNAILHKNEKTFETFLESVFNIIIQSKSSRRYAAYRVQNTMYITSNAIGMLLRDFGYGNKVSDEVLNALKFYIQTSYSGKFVIVDKEQIQNIKSNFIDYSTKSYAKKQEEVKTNPTNSVSISDIGNEVNFEAFIKLKPNDKLIASYVINEKGKGTIEIRTESGEFIGYMANPTRDAITNTFYGINKGWNYDITETTQPVKVVSRFKEALVNLFADKDRIVESLYALDYEQLANKDEIFISELYEMLLEKGLRDFAYFKNPNKQQKIDAILHIKNILARAINNRAAQENAIGDTKFTYNDLIYNDINNWFIKVYNGYNMAYVIANKTKNGKPAPTEVFVETVSYGFLNQDNNTYNPVKTTVENYNHGDNKIVVCIEDKSNGTKYMVGDIENVKYGGNEGTAYIKIKSPGKDFYAELKQRQIKELNSKQITELVEDASQHLSIVLYDYFSKHKSIEDLYEELSYILGTHGLFHTPKEKGHIFYDKNKNSIYIDYEVNGKKQALYINEYNKRGRTHSIIVTDFPEEIKANKRYLLNEKNNAYGFYNGDTSIANGIYLGEEYENNMKILKKVFKDIINNSTFAIDTTILKSDNVAEFETNNPYIKRQIVEKNKKSVPQTIIQLKVDTKGKTKKHEFDSYQQMLIDNNAVLVKLNNDKTGSKIVNDKEIPVSGNWQFSPRGSQLTVRINKKDTEVKGIIDYTVGDERNPLSIKIGSQGLHLTPQESETQFTSLIRNNELNIDYLKAYIAAIDNNRLSKEEKQKIIKHIEKLEEMGLLRGTLYINNAAPLQFDKNGKPKKGTTKAFFSYNYETNNIVIYKNNVNNALNIREFIYGLVHENIHKTIKETYDTEYIERKGKQVRTTSERKKLYKEIENVHRKTLDFLNSEYVEYDGEKLSVAEYLTRRSAELETNSRIWTTQDVNVIKNIISEYGIGNFTSEEEFLIESLTSPILMRFLNLVDSGTEVVESKKESLFDKILRVIAEFLGININKNSLLHELSELYKEFDKNQITLITKEEKALTEEERKILDDESDEDDDYEEIVEDDEIESRFAANSMTSLSEALPDKLQAEFDDLIQSGDLSFSCV